MNTLVLFYSYTGKTKKLAQALAEEMGADICEVRESRRPGVMRAYVLGSLAAMRGKKTPIEPVTADMEAYDTLVVLAPIWAGNPAPAINNVLDAVPRGKVVDIRLVSASGTSRCREALRARLAPKGCTSVTITDIKA